MSIARERLLEEHEGQEVTVHLQRNGSDIVHTGVIERRQTKTEQPYWVVNAKRQAIPDRESGRMGVMPATEVKFLTEDFWYLVVPLETHRQAAEIIQQEIEAQKSRIARPGGSGIVKP
jgi:hypothetical protein